MPKILTHGRGAAAAEPSTAAGETPAPSRRLLPTVTLAVYLVVGALHVWAASAARGPVWTDDEVGPMATARLFAGVGTPMDLAHQSYYPGWAVLLTPIWWFTTDPATAYRAAVLLSALCATLVVLPLSAIARRVGAGAVASVVVAGIVAVAPGRSTFSSYALIENCLVLVFATTVLAALRHAESRTVRRAVVLGLAAAATFVVHGRMVAVVGATVLWFLVEVVRGNRRAGTAGAITTVVAAGAGYLLHVVASSALYGDGTGREESAIASLVRGDLPAIAQAFVGQVWYASAAWLVLPLLGVWWMLAAVLRELRSRRPGVASWSAVILAGTAAISVLTVAEALTRGSPRLDILTYGRYVEPLLVVLALVGLALVARARPLPPAVPAVALAVTVVTSVLVVRWGLERAAGEGWWAPINVAGLLGLSRFGGGAPPWVAASLLAVVLGVGYVVGRTRPAVRRVLVGAVAALSLAGGVAAHTTYLREFNAGLGNPPQVVGVLEDIDARAVSYDVHGADWVGQNTVQYWLADLDVHVFDSTEQDPPTDLVISRASWPAGERAGAVLVSDTPRDESLWVMPGPYADALVARGATTTPESTEPLEDFAATAERVDAPADASVPDDRESRLEVALTNDGDTTWAPLSGDDPEGVVRLVAWWPVAGGRAPQLADLPHAVVPGATVTVELPLDPPADLTEGDLEVTLVQEGFGELTPPGAPLLTLPVD
ncbi:hypothetical protein [Cellulomonas sp.]|uniref:hypothetical protein n=1 Tax=Cellulomonas sp. TaxID=40001 RepID=UPI002810CAAF|nr:hypothetical protein [Cellulomonas sp.]